MSIKKGGEMMTLLLLFMFCFGGLRGSDMVIVLGITMIADIITFMIGEWIGEK